MLTVTFEDDAVDALGAPVAGRPACDLLLGATTLHDALGRFGQVRRALRDHLARHLEGCRDRGMAAWGGAVDAGHVSPAASTHGELALDVNARAIPSRANLATLRGLVDGGRRCIVHAADGTIAAALLHRGTANADDACLARLLATGPAAVPAIDGLGLPHADTTLELVATPHGIVTAHERSIADGLALAIDSGAFVESRPGLFVAADARVAAEAVVRGGPVVVAAGAEIGPFVCLDGPAWIGPQARVNPHAWIRAGTALGRGCRVGGEIEASVIEPFSNKAHEGFLGHSHVGSWTNLAAGTTTSDLKTSYGPVRLHGFKPDGSRLTIHTGRQFLGALIGDFVKTGIHASIPCGARIGPAATVGGVVPEQVASFTNTLVGGESGGRSSAAQAATVLGRMMERRGVPFLQADRELLEALAASGR